MPCRLCIGVRNGTSYQLNYSQASHGLRIALTETLVDLSRFADRCSRAANWIEVGVTLSFGRTLGDVISYLV